MKRKLAGVLLGGFLLAGVLAGPASARTDGTITVKCVDNTTGAVTFVHVVDANALSGSTTSNDVYNVVNPLNETCTPA
jgi:hypothetical protein